MGVGFSLSSGAQAERGGGDSDILSAVGGNSKHEVNILCSLNNMEGDSSRR